MKINKKAKRLKAIKQIYPLLFSCDCKVCNNEFVREPMFKADRWGVNKTIHSWCYCKECMSTKEDVLFEIDTDECIFGIAFVDDYWKFKKLDYTRMKFARPPITR